MDALSSLSNLLFLPQSSVVLHEFIGEGGYSKVWRATYTNVAGQKFQAAAKKVLSCSLEDAEICNMKQMNHENIIKFYGVWKENDDNFYIIMELAEKGDLRKFLTKCRQENNRPTIECILKWTYQAARAIQYLKGIGFSHRDIKSLNFLIMGDYTLKLGDLGLATKLYETQATKQSGTTQWVAPEVYMEELRSPKSDIFSFAVVIWEIITTDFPYAKHKGDFQVMNAVCSGERPEIPDKCPEVLKTIMSCCWDADRKKRPDIDLVCQILLQHQCPSVARHVESLATVSTTCTDGRPTTSSATSGDVGMKSVSSLCSSSDVDRDVKQLLQELGIADEDIPSQDIVFEEFVTKTPQEKGPAPVRAGSEKKAPLSPPHKVEYYRMRNKPHGICVIINNVDFSTARLTKQKDGFNDRKGSEVDAANLEDLFSSLNYKVETHTNLNAIDMYDRLDETRKVDHSNFDCFVCCILTHGTNGNVYGCDGEQQTILSLTELFRANICRSLSGKPKFFIFESCQGHKRQGTTRTLQHDGISKEESIPNESDFVLGYATVPGHVAYRHTTKGSWYINALVDTIKDTHDKNDILTCLTMVNKHLSSFKDNEGKKQTASVFNTLRKCMYLCDVPEYSCPKSKLYQTV